MQINNKDPPMLISNAEMWRIHYCFSLASSNSLHFFSFQCMHGLGRQCCASSWTWWFYFLFFISRIPACFSGHFLLVFHALFPPLSPLPSFYASSHVRLYSRMYHVGKQLKPCNYRDLHRLVSSTLGLEEEPLCPIRARSNYICYT